MNEQHPLAHLNALQKIERTGILCTLGHDRLASGLFYSHWRNRATEEQKRIGWETAVRIEKVLCTVLHEAHEQQVEETTNPSPKGIYKSYLD
jgi:hypothetical protein